MNTKPTEGTKPEELPITPGEAILKEEHFRNPATDEYEYYGRIEVGSHRVCVFDEDCDDHVPALYANAHNTYRRTKVLPSDLAERLEEARRLLLAIATHSEQAGNDNVRGADLRLSTPSINAFLTRTKQP